jgi:hypothetical protein
MRNFTTQQTTQHATFTAPRRYAFAVFPLHNLTARRFEADWNRTRDLPTCSALPQPTALPRAHNANRQNLKSVYHYNKKLVIQYLIHS